MANLEPRSASKVEFLSKNSESNLEKSSDLSGQEPDITFYLFDDDERIISFQKKAFDEHSKIYQEIARKTPLDNDTLVFLDLVQLEQDTAAALARSTVEESSKNLEKAPSLGLGGQFAVRRSFLRDLPHLRGMGPKDPAPAPVEQAVAFASVRMSEEEAVIREDLKKRMASNRLFESLQRDKITGVVGVAKTVFSRLLSPITGLSKAEIKKEKAQRLLDAAEEYLRESTRGKWLLPDPSAATEASGEKTYSKFNKMPAFNSGVVARLVAGLPSRAELELPSGESVVLGMLPNAEILAKIRELVSADNPRQALTIMSIVEGFELSWAQGNLRGVGIDGEFKETGGSVSFGAPEDKPTAIRFYKKLTLEVGPKEAREIIRVLQYGTPDRTMTVEPLLEDAMRSLMGEMMLRKPVFVHCKSGKGRSATVVLAARVGILIDHLKNQGVQITQKVVDDLIAEQHALMKEARREVNVTGSLQLPVLEAVLYKHAGVISGYVEELAPLPEGPVPRPVEPASPSSEEGPGDVDGWWQ